MFFKLYDINSFLAYALRNQKIIYVAALAFDGFRSIVNHYPRHYRCLVQFGSYGYPGNARDPRDICLGFLPCITYTTAV